MCRAGNRLRLGLCWSHEGSGICPWEGKLVTERAQDTKQQQKRRKDRSRGSYCAFAVGQEPHAGLPPHKEPAVCQLLSASYRQAARAQRGAAPCLRSHEYDCAHFVDGRLKLGGVA